MKAAGQSNMGVASQTLPRLAEQKLVRNTKKHENNALV
jgi:hypothetical protein